MFEDQSTLGNALGQFWLYMDSPDEYRFSISNMPTEASRGSFGTWSVYDYLIDEFEDAGFEVDRQQ